MSDKNQAVIDFLLQCPAIRNSPTFFNFLEAKDNNKQLVPAANDKLLDRTFIDGSVQKRFTFTLFDYRSVAYQAIVKQSGYLNENMEEYQQVQEIMNWVEEQAKLKNYPDFGTNCIVDSMRTTTNNPTLNGVDTSVKPALARYSMTIQINYLDMSKVIWK